MHQKNKKTVQEEFLAMDVSWLPGDLEIYENDSDPLESWLFTMARIITLIMAIIVHRAFYKLMKRLPGRAVNEMIYPNMVRYVQSILCNDFF